MIKTIIFVNGYTFQKCVKTVKNVYSMKTLTKVETSQNVAVYTSCKLGNAKTDTKHMSGSCGQKKMERRLVCVIMLLLKSFCYIK